MRLESKHIVSYLPYELQGLDIKGEIITLSGIKGETYFIKECSNNYAYGDIADFNPVLRPFSDITKEIEEGFNVYSILSLRSRKDFDNGNPLILKWSFEDIQKLLQYNFDIYGLIENGLAIDINTIEL